MSAAAVYEQLLRYVVTKTEDPELNARKRRTVRVLVDMTPEVRDELVDEGRVEGRLEGRLTEARAVLRRVLTLRNLVPSQQDEARIAGCTDLPTLERWHDQALAASSIAEALR